MNEANTILQQLGGGRFLAMTGAVALAGEGSAIFKLGTMSRASAVEISLDQATDTYTVQAYRGRGLKMCRYGKPIEGVHADQLKTVFTEMTGLAVSL